MVKGYVYKFANGGVVQIKAKNKAIADAVMAAAYRAGGYVFIDINYAPL